MSRLLSSVRTTRGCTRKSIDLRSSLYDKVVRGLMALLLRRPWRLLIFLLGRKLRHVVQDERDGRRRRRENARYKERQEATPAVGSGRRHHFVEPAKAESKFREITNVYSLQNSV